jgi:hypothetical protein
MNSIFKILPALALLISCGGGSNSIGTLASSTAAPTTAASPAPSIAVVPATSSPAAPLICDVKITDFTVQAGAITTSPDNCGKFIAYSNASAGPYSTGKFEYNKDFSNQISIDAKFKKISGNAIRPMEIYFLGGAFGWTASGQQSHYYFYESETHWSGWLDSNLFNLNDSNRVTVNQTGQSVTVSINGVELATYVLNAAVTQKRVSVYFKGDPGVQESIEFEQLSVKDKLSLPPTPLPVFLNPPMNVTTTRGTGYIDVSWLVSASATGYDVWREVSPGTPAAYASIRTNSYHDTNVTAGLQYCYYISARREFTGGSEVTSHPYYSCIVAAAGNVVSSNIISNGMCGSMDKIPQSKPPTVLRDLCAAGNPTPINGVGPWNWSCIGTGSGATTASCTAPFTPELPGV